MNILGIETSCDDTSAAILCSGEVLSSIVSTQLQHSSHGGIIPELAARSHQKNLLSVIDRALSEANMTLDDIQLIATTHGPGLVGPLLIGVNTAKGLGLAKNIPVIPINHIEAHIYANFISHANFNPPAMTLVVSGGHTEIIYFRDHNDYQLIGKTRDDAAGECLDKVSKMMGLGFPGGKILDEYAQKGNTSFYKFPRAMPDSFDFSFSGLKTAVKVFLEQNEKQFLKKNIYNIAASFMDAVTDSLSIKLLKAAMKYKTNKIAIAGGVSANSMLRQKISKIAKKENIDVFYPSLAYCTDNAAMVACVAYTKIKNNVISKDQLNNSLDIDAIPNLRLTN